VRTQAVVIACIIAAASVLLAWATTPPGPRGVAPPRAAPDTFSVGFDVPSVRTLKVASAGLEASVTGDPDWMLTLPAGDSGSQAQPATWPANPDAVRVLLNELANQSIEEAEHTSQSESIATITISAAGEITTIKVMGQPLAGLLPVRVISPDGSIRDGFVPASRFRPTDAGQLAALANPKPFDLDGVISRVSIKPGTSPEFQIERRAGIWSFPASGLFPAARVHQPTVRAMLADLRRVRASNVIVPFDGSSLAGEPFLTVGVGADLPRKAGNPRRTRSARVVIMQQSTVEGAYNALATRTAKTGAQTDLNHQLQIRLDPRSFPVLPADASTLLDPVPLPWQASDTALIENRSPDSQQFTLRKTIDGWTWGDQRIPTQLIDAVLSRLATAYPVGFSAQTPSSAEDLVLYLEPIVSGEGVTLNITILDDRIEIRSSGVVWTTADTDGSLRDAIRRLGSIAAPATYDSPAP